MADRTWTRAVLTTAFTLFLCSLCVLAMAGKAHIVIGRGLGGMNSVTITGAEPNQPVSVNQVDRNGVSTQADSTSPSNTTDASGNADKFDIEAVGAASLTITIGSEVFTGITQTGDFAAADVKPVNGPTLDDFGPLPFGGKSSFFEFEGNTVNLLSLINTSNAHPFDFTGLVVYSGLDMDFFNSIEFASPAAIASGTLFSDVLAEEEQLTIPISGGSPAILTFSAPGKTNTYNLIVGTARPILSNNTFGPDVGFAFAGSAVPEPGTLALLGGLVVPGLMLLRRRRA
jgi:hypothetical protein